MIYKPHQLLQEARASDHVVSSFRVVSRLQAEGVITASSEPIAVSVSGVAYKQTPGLFSEIESIAKQSSSKVMLQLEEPVGRIQALTAQEHGVQSFVLLPNQLDLVPELRSRGAWVGVIAPDRNLAAIRTLIASGVDGVVISPPRTKGAFTGQEYIVFDTWHSLLHAIPNVSVCIQDIANVSTDHVRQLADSVIAQMVFDIPSEVIESKEAVQQFVVSKLAGLHAENLVH